MSLIEIPIKDRVTGVSSNKRLNHSDMLVVKSHDGGSGAMIWMVDRFHPGRINQLEVTASYASLKTSLVTTYASHFEDLTVSEIGDAENAGPAACLLRKQDAVDLRIITSTSCYLDYKVGPAELRLKIDSLYLLVLAGLNS